MSSISYYRDQLAQALKANDQISINHYSQTIQRMEAEADADAKRDLENFSPDFLFKIPGILQQDKISADQVPLLELVLKAKIAGVNSEIIRTKCKNQK